MFSVDLSTREYGGHVVVALRGELDIADAAAVEAVTVYGCFAALGGMLGLRVSRPRDMREPDRAVIAATT